MALVDFPQISGQQNINPLLDYANASQAMTASELAGGTLGARTQIAQNQAQSGQLANQLASNTLGSQTQIAANQAQNGQLANQALAQKTPLEIAGMRQSLGLDPNPALDKMVQAYNGGQTSSATPSQSTSSNDPGPPGLGTRESGNDPSKVNAGGFLGMFQLGAARASDPGVGIYTPAKGEDVNKNTWDGTFHIPGYAGVKTKADFLANADAQRAALGAEINNTNQAIANTPGADKLSISGLQAVAHIGGVAGMQKFVATGGAYNPPDPNGTRLSDYYNEFSKGGPAALHQTFGYKGVPYPGGQQTAAATPPAAPGVTVGPDPNAPPPPANGPQTAMANPPPGAPVSDATPGNGVATAQPPAGTQNVDAVMQRLRAAQTATPDAPGVGAVTPGGASAQPAPDVTAQPAQSAGATPAPIPPPAGGQPQAGVAAPVASAPAPQPGTGINSPQVQQAQSLYSRATQIELMAAASPNDPRVKAAAAAMVADLRQRAGVLMQADSQIVDPATGIQTSTLSGKQSSAAEPRGASARETQVELPDGSHQMEKDGKLIGPVIAPSSREFTMSMAKKDNDQVPALAQQALDQEQTIQKTIEARNVAAQIPTGANFDARSATANWLKTYFPAIGKQLRVGEDGALLPDPGTASEGAKLLTGAAQQNEKAMGGSGGLGITTMFVKNNPNLDMQPTAIRDMSNLNAVTQMANKDYLQAKISHIANQTQNLTAPGSDGSYKPTSAFEKQWFSQNNTNVYYGAVQAMNQKPFAVWSKGLSDAEKQRALGVIARIDPTSKVVGDNGHPLAVSKFMPQDMTNPSGVAVQ